MPKWCNDEVFHLRLSERQRASLIQRARDWHVTPSAVVRFALNRLLAEQPRPEQAQGEK